MKFSSQILTTFFVCFLVGNANASLCSFKTQLKYQDGSIGCVEDLPFANEVDKGSNEKIIYSINTTKAYVIAMSTTPKCKAIAVSRFIGLFGQTNWNVPNLDAMNKTALDSCMNQGCDCEVVISDGNVLVDKEILQLGYGLTEPSKSILNQVNSDKNQIQQEQIKKAQLAKNTRDKVLAEKARNASLCSFKTQLKYQDGSIGCVEDLPFANEIGFGLTDKVIDSINSTRAYVIAMSKSPQCRAIGLAKLKISGRTGSSGLADFHMMSQDALDSCMNQGCDCEVVIEDGVVLVDKESLLSGRGLTIPSQSIGEQIAAEQKQIQQEQSKKSQLEKQQVELASKIKSEKEKSLAEEKRIQIELAKNNQDKALAEKARIEQENRLAEEVNAQVKLAKLQAQEKEKADSIAKLQQEKEAKEKALSAQKSDEERIAVLRKELEKEIRSSIQKESLGAQAMTMQQSKLPPTIFANRKALVIGNDSYQAVAPLLNAREDAKVVAENLISLGYKVSLKLDVTQKQFKSELRSFKSQVQPGDEVAIFYAGHGVQIASTNYLLPVDIIAHTEEEIKDDGVSLQRLLDDMNEKNAKFTLAVIDACRDNPFKGASRAIGSRGLAPTTAATGQMIVFSAGTGQQALDTLGPNDKSKNGLFTRVFVKEIQKAGVSVDRVVRNVRTEVVALAKSIGRDQVPAIYDQVVGEFYFKQ